MKTLQDLLASLIISFILSAFACITYNYSLRVIFDLPYISVLQMWLIRETIQILIVHQVMEDQT